MGKVRLLFFCSKFGGGGAEMHLLRVLKCADLDKYDIHLAVTRGGGGYEPQLPKEVAVHALADNSSSTAAWLMSILPLKRLIKKLEPAVIISFMDPQNVVLALIKKYSKKCPPIILCCQNAIEINLQTGNLKNKLIFSAIKSCYDHAEKIIAISNGVKNELTDSLGINKNIEVIYNAGFDNGYEQRAAETLPDNLVAKPNQLVACGRLYKQKGFDVLLDSIALLAKKLDVNLWLLGEGSDKDALVEQANSLGIANRVNFLGFQNNPYKFFARADAFILSSRWEGFGNVITEAMICGTPVVATDCDFGPNEIITDGMNGLLAKVGSSQDLANKIERLLIDEALQKKFVDKGVIRAKNFTMDTISKAYFKGIEQTI